MKKILMGIATGLALLAPVATVISCTTKSEVTEVSNETKIKEIFKKATE